MGAYLDNPHRGRGIADLGGGPRRDGGGVARLLALCPAHAQTPLLDLPALADRFGIARLWAKDERNRMGLGSFKGEAGGDEVRQAAQQACTNIALNQYAKRLANITS